MKKKILFVLRNDAERKGGGDLVQAKAYQDVLKKAFSCEVLFSHEISLADVRGTQWDLIQIFNISRLHENMTLLKGVSYKKLVLCPIMQPGFSFSLKLALKNYARNLFSIRASFFDFLINSDSLLERFDALVFLSEAEREAFFKAFPSHTDISNAIYHNGVIQDISLSSHERVFEFICVGRIEPKKRTNEVIDTVCSAAPGSLLICFGSLNWYHPLYCAKFLLRVLKGKVIYLGNQRASTVNYFMQRTNTLLNFSELEVSPLVDLEALACGSSVVSTKYSYTHLSTGGAFNRIDVKDRNQCAQALKAALHEDRHRNVEVGTWLENSSNYRRLVSEMLDSGTSTSACTPKIERN